PCIPRCSPGVESAAGREVEIEQEHLEAFSSRDRDEARHGAGRLHLVASGGEEPRQVLREQPLVLENEHPAGHDLRESKESAMRTKRIPAVVAFASGALRSDPVPQNPTDFGSRAAAPATPSPSRAPPPPRRGAYPA